MNCLQKFIKEHPEVKYYQFEKPVISVSQAVEVSGYDKANFIKTIGVKHKTEDIFICAIITASARVDKKLLIEGINSKRWRMATPDEIMEYTGFPVGGVPPICLGERVTKFVDPRVLKKEFVIGGGGTTTSLIGLPPRLIVEDGAQVKVVSKG